MVFIVAILFSHSSCSSKIVHYPSLSVIIDIFLSDKHSVGFSVECILPHSQTQLQFFEHPHKTNSLEPWQTPSERNFRLMSLGPYFLYVCSLDQVVWVVYGQTWFQSLSVLPAFWGNGLFSTWYGSQRDYAVLAQGNISRNKAFNDFLNTVRKSQRFWFSHSPERLCSWWPSKTFCSWWIAIVGFHAVRT